MKQATRRDRIMPLAFGVAALALALPATASAQLRASAFAGAEFLRQGGGAGVLRGEASISLLPFIHVGAYLQGNRDFNEAVTAPSAGGFLAFRPGIPFTRWDPMAFASLGWTRVGNDDGGVLNLGGALVRHSLPFLDLEFRGALVQHLGMSQGNTGFQVAIGLSLHP
ncbi:MAG: hypothetical protein JNK72_25320 [Myxococcales bacterium]|nr:hypothetical protein [Myxococcales bacterium]